MHFKDSLQMLMFYQWNLSVSQQAVECENSCCILLDKSDCTENIQILEKNKEVVLVILLYTHMQIHAEHNDTMKTSNTVF